MAVIFKKDDNFVFSILGLMTPIDIAKLTKDSTGVTKVSLTEVLIKGDILLDQAKEKIRQAQTSDDPSKSNDSNVLEFPKNETKVEAPDQSIDSKEQVATKAAATESSVKQTDTKENIKEVKVNIDELELSKEEKLLLKAGIKSDKQKEYEEKVRSELENKDKKSTSVFILEEQAKLRSSRDKIKKKEVLDNYSDNVAVDLNKGSDKSEEVVLTESHDMGVLVNKKQY